MHNNKYFNALIQVSQIIFLDCVSTIHIQLMVFVSHLFLFCLSVGMHFSQAVAIIQSQVGVIKGVQVLYSETVSNALLLFYPNYRLF